MLKDVPRTEAYQKAILGNKEQFEGKIVMDIGAGTGKKKQTRKHFPMKNQVGANLTNRNFLIIFCF